MRKKTSLTIVERAMVFVPEFKSRAVKLEHQVVLRGQSASTLNNYIRRIALFVIHFEKLPEQLSEDEINEYLVALARDPKAPSRSSFKHMVYGLRYYYRLLGMNKKAIALPSLKQDTKLPLHSFGYTHYGCETGAVAVLHIPLGGTGSGGKTFLCIRICTALFRQPVIPCRENGAISANMIIICIRCTS